LVNRIECAAPLDAVHAPSVRILSSPVVLEPATLVGALLEPSASARFTVTDTSLLGSAREALALSTTLSCAEIV
jgi:hypothetical protein